MRILLAPHLLETDCNHEHVYMCASLTYFSERGSLWIDDKGYCVKTLCVNSTGCLRVSFLIFLIIHRSLFLSASPTPSFFLLLYRSSHWHKLQNIQKTKGRRFNSYNIEVATSLSLFLPPSTEDSAKQSLLCVGNLLSLSYTPNSDMFEGSIVTLLSL